jgi:hypothetical protein
VYWCFLRVDDGALPSYGYGIYQRDKCGWGCCIDSLTQWCVSMDITLTLDATPRNDESSHEDDGIDRNSTGR